MLNTISVTVSIPVSNLAGSNQYAQKPIKFQTQAGKVSYNSTDVPDLARLAGLTKENIDAPTRQGIVMTPPAYEFASGVFSILNGAIEDGEYIVIPFHK